MKSYETEQGNNMHTAAQVGEDTRAVQESEEIEEIDETGTEVGIIDLPEEEDAGPSQLVAPGGVEDDVDMDEEDGPRGFRFRRPSREQVIEWLPFIAVVLLGAILRYWNLGAKPLHHDESLHA